MAGSDLEASAFRNLLYIDREGESPLYDMRKGSGVREGWHFRGRYSFGFRIFLTFMSQHIGPLALQHGVKRGQVIHQRSLTLVVAVVRYVGHMPDTISRHSFHDPYILVLPGAHPFIYTPPNIIMSQQDCTDFLFFGGSACSSLFM